MPLAKPRGKQASIRRRIRNNLSVSWIVDCPPNQGDDPCSASPSSWLSPALRFRRPLMLREVAVPVVEAAAAQVAAVRVPVPVPAPQPEQVPEARDLRRARGPEWAPHPAAPVRGRQPLRGWGRVPLPQAPTSTPTGARAIRTFSRRLRTARRRQRRKLRGTLAPAMRPMDCRSAARAPGPAMKIRNNPVPVQMGPRQAGPYHL
jgi:hypothetical protein